MGARDAEIVTARRRHFGPRAAALVALLLAGEARPPASDAQPQPSTAPSGSLTDTSTVIRLPGYEVSAARPLEDPQLRLGTGFARAYDVTASRGRLRTVADVLTAATGVHVRDFGGVGSFSTLSIRGSSSGQVAVYLDGVPLNSAQYGVVNVADLPIEAIERIEVYRGSAPLGFESPGGGVIHLITDRRRGRWLRASGGGGSFGTDREDVGFGWRAGRTSVMAVGQLLRGRGDFAYLDDNATPYNAGDDTTRARVNNDLWLASATGRAEQRLGPLALSLTHDQLDKEHGTPGIGANPALEARFRTERQVSNLRLAWAGAKEEPGADRSAAALRLYQVRQRDRFSDPRGELTGVRQDNDNRTLRWGSQVLVPIALGWGQSLGFAVEGRREQYQPRLNLPAPRELPSANREFASWAAEDRWTFGGGRYSLVGSVRRQVTADQFPGGSPYPGALPVPATEREVWQTSWTCGARADLLAGLNLKGSVARLARMPTFEELFGNVGGIYGNPRARPEQVTTRDVGLVGLWRPGARSRTLWPAWVDAQLSTYRSDAIDLLTFLPNSQQFSVAQNISAARLSGVELSSRAGWAGGLSTDLSWTRQWTRDRGEVAYWNGRELPGRPRDEGALQISHARPRWQVGYELHLVSANYLDRANLARIPARALHDLAAAFRTGPAEWIAECVNLTDRRVEDFAGFPLPGRSFFVGARVRLDRKETPP